MTAQPFTLAVSCARPDQEFPSLLALARAIVAVRDHAPGRPPLRLRTAELWRGGLPGGTVVSVTLEDGLGPRLRTFVGFAFVPEPNAVARLTEALRIAGGVGLAA